MASAPDITFRRNVTPYDILAAAIYAQSTLGGNNLPVLQGENSNTNYFRIYNNYARSAGIASAFNVQVTSYDAVDPSSHTDAKSVINQSWIKVQENGYGENSTPPGLYSRFIGEDTAIGGTPATHDIYIPEYGSDGSTTPQIRAGSDTNGVGFIELASHAELPDVVGSNSLSFAISILYEWTS